MLANYLYKLVSKVSFLARICVLKACGFSMICWGSW